jgi:hypothetical protein
LVSDQVLLKFTHQRNLLVAILSSQLLALQITIDNGLGLPAFSSSQRVKSSSICKFLQQFYLEVAIKQRQISGDVKTPVFVPSLND